MFGQIVTAGLVIFGGTIAFLEIRERKQQAYFALLPLDKLPALQGTAAEIQMGTAIRLDAREKCIKVFRRYPIGQARFKASIIKAFWYGESANWWIVNGPRILESEDILELLDLIWVEEVWPQAV